jgi:hypothetical protein
MNHCGIVRVDARSDHRISNSRCEPTSNLLSRIAYVRGPLSELINDRYNPPSRDVNSYGGVAARNC